MNERQSAKQILRKPSWLKVRPPYSNECRNIKSTLAGLQLHTVCQEAACPNMSECFACGTATFLIMGNICTRDCLYCNVEHGRPEAIDENEVNNLIDAVRKMKLEYVVITSVTRDDLPDGGAQVFSDYVKRLREKFPACKVEVLIPDFQGNSTALEKVIAARPDVINHNMEVVKQMFTKLRPQGNYDVSLAVLKKISSSSVISKTGFMIGFGERREDILRLIDDLASVSCARLTIGQYQQPTLIHWPVAKYYHPDEFAEFKEIAYQQGFQYVEAGPLVRSSYHAAKAR
ncbi:MAG: lipoyl synthase [Deltaproteobacteria bacterium HGW-Deltaproteobacteria-10]|jgi:lipoic acid synthetase|nr:MAG: lipoyl synthase [Deltaproteobacteria bacterium HGW-Deltaproteobacteria-2]PKN63815.1 MAG: lipoyl synthase [Deltaproteobacteria bacterium HGW-Deltaproteobacteria-10]